MLGIDERALRIIWTSFLFALLVTVVWFVRETLVVFALAIFFAYMLTPVVAFVERMVPQRRTLALSVVYVILVGLIVFAGIELIPRLIEEISNFLTALPKLVAKGRIQSLPLPPFLRPYQGQIAAYLSSQAGGLQARVLPLLQEAGPRILSGLSALLPIILIPILAFFFLKDGETIRVSLIGAVDSGRDRTLMEQILDDIHIVLKNYIRALVLLAVAAFICWFAFNSILSYPYGLLLAGLAALGEFIPVIGPAAALAVMGGVCLITGSGSLIFLIVFWGVYRMFADYVLNPYLMSSGIELHPLLVLFGVLAGESIAGVPGMFFSVPVIAILRVVYVNLRKAYTHRQLSEGVPVDLKVATPMDVPGGLLVPQQAAEPAAK